jgi:hypothetical protein
MDNILNNLKEGEGEGEVGTKDESHDQNKLEIEPTKRHIINYLTLINEINRDTFHIGC